MLPGFRFIFGAVLASVVLIVVAFAIAATVRMAHLARMGPLDSSRSLAYVDPNDAGSSRLPDAVGSIDRMTRRTDSVEGRRRVTAVEPLPAPLGPEPVIDGKLLAESEATDEADDLAAEPPAEAMPAAIQRTVVVASPIITGKPDIPVALSGTNVDQVAAGDMADVPADERPRITATAGERMPASEIKVVATSEATVAAATDIDPAVIGATDNIVLKETKGIPAKEVASIPARRVDLLSPPEAKPAPTVGERVASVPPPTETAAVSRDGQQPGSDAAGADAAGADAAGGIGGPFALVTPEPPKTERPATAPETKRAVRAKAPTKNAKKPQSKTAAEVRSPEQKQVASVPPRTEPAAAIADDTDPKVEPAGEAKPKGNTAAPKATRAVQSKTPTSTAKKPEIKAAAEVRSPEETKVASVPPRTEPAAAIADDTDPKAEPAGEAKPRGKTAAKGKRAKTRKAARSRRTVVRRGLIRPTAQTGYPISVHPGALFR